VLGLTRLPFPVAVAVLAAGTAAGVVASVRTGTVLWLLVAVAGVAVFGVLYLREYAKLPGPEDEPAAPKPPRRKPQVFANETPPPAAESSSETPAAEAPPSGPVEVDAFDPDYDPVADADALETKPANTPPRSPEA
jgi:hypothetical protein